MELSPISTGGESSTDVLTVSADNRWPGRVILDLGAGDDVMRTGNADITKNLSGSAD